MTPTPRPGCLALKALRLAEPLQGQLSWGTEAGDWRGLGNRSQEGNCIIHFFCLGYLSGFSVRHRKEPVCEKLKGGHKIPRGNKKRIYSQGLPVNVF